MASALGASCEGEEGSDESPRCLPGESRLCHCADGRAGRQVCAQDGKSVGDCECSGLAATPDAGAAAKQAPPAPTPATPAPGTPATAPAAPVTPQPPAVPLPPAPPPGPAAEAVTAAPGADASAVVLYRFDEGQGEAAADSGSSGLHAKVEAATWTAGRFGKGLLFDGQKSLVRPSGPVPLTGDAALTVEAWVRPESSRSMVVVQLAEGVALELRSRDAAVEAVFQLALGGAGFTLASSSALALWQWHHVAGTFDGTTMRLFIDGRLDGELAASGAIGPMAGCDAPAIGGSCRGDGGWFHGGIDEVRVSRMARYLPPPEEPAPAVAGRTKRTGAGAGAAPTKAGGADAGPIKGLPPGFQDSARQLGKMLGIETP